MSSFFAKKTFKINNNMNLRHIILVLSYWALCGYSQRICKSLDDNWMFGFSHQVGKGTGVRLHFLIRGMLRMPCREN